MARVICAARMTPFTVNANETKTLVQLLAAANQGVALLRAKVSFEGVTAGDKPVALQLVKQTDAGTGGNSLTEYVVTAPVGSAPTPTTTALGGEWATTEPTTTDIIDEVYCHPQSGYEWVWQRGQDELSFFNSRYAIRVATASSGFTASNVACTVWWEE